MYVNTQFGQLLLAVLLSSHLVCSSQVNSTLLYINQPSSMFTQGRVLYNFQTTTPGSVYRIEFQEECSNDTFTIDSSNGELSLVRTIDFTAEGTSHDPRCVTDNSGSYFITAQTFNCFVTVGDTTGIPFVLNVLPTFPTTQLIFPFAFYSGYVVEGIANATVTILSNSGDLIQAFTSPTRGLLIPSYRVIGQYASDFFVIQKQTNCDVNPFILTTRPLDRTQQSSFELTLEAYESSLFARTTVRVDVIDTNNYTPQFVSTPLTSLRVRKDVTPGTELTRFQASDIDTGLSGDVRFSIPNPASPFAVHPLSGSLRVFSTQSLENAQLTVGVTDLGVPPLSTLMNTTIFIDDINTFPPDINIHSLGPRGVSITEHASINHVVTTVEISDSDSTDVALVLSNNSPCDCFQLSTPRTAQNGSQLYDIIVSGDLDFETAPNGRYQVLLTATDNGMPQLSTQYRLQLNIMDENEPPSFAQSLYNASVLEGVPIGSHIVRMEAIDPDSGQTEQLTYTLTSSSPSASLFAMHSTTGTIYTVGQLNYELTNSVQFTVTASDLESLSANTTLIVTILDRNDNRPSFTTTTRSITIAETSDTSRSIFQFSTTDMDSECNGAVEYSIIHQEPRAFRIDSFSGLLYPLSDTSIDYESFQNARVIVCATDLGKLSSYSTETVLNISITDVNDEAPVIDPIGCPCFITEDIPHGSTCQPLSAHDADSDSSSLQFSFVSGNELDHMHFTINASSGVVSSNSVLRYEQQSEYTLGISVSDGTLVSETVNLTVLVVDINNRGPQYTGPIRFTIPQDLAVGEFAGNVGAQHSDAGYNGLTRHTFGSGTANSVTNTFKLDPLSGDLSLKQSTSSTSYTFTVVAHDLVTSMMSTMSATASVTITVSGMKNNPPRFIPSLDHRTVSAGLEVDSLVSQLSAYDGDTGTNGQLTYHLVDGYGNHSGLFRVNSSGALISNQRLSNREGSVYALNISATDSGNPPLTAYLELIITVYPSTVMVGGVELFYNPIIVEVCHFNASFQEQLNFEQTLFTLDPTVGGTSATYTILGGPFSAAFEILTLTREFTTQGGFGDTVFNNREAVFVTLRAQFGGNFHFCSVTVVLEDIDNNPPVFLQSLYTIDVYENTPIGSSVFRFTVEDNDVGRNTISRFTREPPSVPFEIDENTGVLIVDGTLTQDQYRFAVTADDIYLPGPTGMATTMVEVNILRQPNAQPIVVPGSTSFNVSETASILDSIAIVMITDNDRGSHGDNRLCIASGNVCNYFGFVLNELVVRNKLDYETAPTHFDLVLRAYDSSPNPQFADITVSIDVVDQNDEVPVFTTTSYIATIPENQSSGSTVLTVSATDRDTETNGQITYSIPSGYPFSINPTSGLITTTSSLDRETFQSYTFNVTATDQGTPVQLSSSAVVNILVLDENDRRPSFITPSGNTFSISEDTVIPPLEATDEDEEHNSLLVYSIISGNDDYVFTLDPWTGLLTYDRKLNDATASNSYQLTFQVTDLGDSSRSALSPLVMTFVFEDVNMNHPVFDSLVYECALLEGSTAFTSNCQVHATDPDRTGSTITYSIQSLSGNDDSTFSIGSTNGVISVEMLLDADTRPSIYLLVQAEDSGTPSLSARALVIVNINDVNDNLPTFNQQGFRIRVPENLPANTLLSYVNAVDADHSQLNSEVSYSITIGDTSIFRLDSNQGAVFLRRGLDYETTMMSSFVILAQDISQGNAPQILYNIEVVDANENFLPPVFALEDNLSVVTVSRNAIPGTDIITLVASDPDLEQSSVVYYIVDGTGYGYFEVGLTNGTISTVYPLTAVEEDTLSLVVMARDGGSFPLSSKHTLTVILDSSGTKPFFSSPVLTANPFENIGAGSIFTFVRAGVDGYVDSRICYSISSGNDAGKFAVNNSTGAVSLASGVLDRQLVPTYNLSITASLAGISEASKMLLIIELSDANNFNPQFPAADYSMSIFENYPINQPFARIFARDDDLGENGRLVYTLQNSGSTLPFAISESTGSIRLTSSLDIATTSSYSLTVTARDNGTPQFTRSVSFTITVIEPATVSDPTPFFSTVSTAVNEDDNPGVVITTITPSNAVSNTLMYRFDSPEPMEFGIVPNTGEVYLTQSLDYETSVRHTLNVRVSDGFHDEVSLVLLVTVMDANDNMPLFVDEEYRFSVTEHAQSETEIGIVTATDMDTNSELSYTLVDSQHPSSLSLFAINSDGSVRVIGDVDREDVSTHVLTVAVSDGLFLNYVRIIVRVIDTNDHIPTFFPFPLTNIYIPEDTTVGTGIHTVRAFDPDEGLNSVVSYTLQNSGVPFQVNSTTGSITTLQSLDFETRSLYTLSIAAFNPSNPSLTASLQLSVSVLDVLDSAPTLQLNPNSVTVLENLPAYSTVSKVTSDSTNRPIYYSIVAGNALGHFVIEPLTGVVRTALPLNREQVSSYVLTIQGAFELGYESNVTLSVRVLDENDNAPQFSSLYISFQVPEIRTTTVDFNLNVVDPDEGTNGQISLYWVADSFASNYFSFDTSGNLMVLQPLDKVNIFSSVTFTLYAFDSGTPQQYSQTLVNIEVLDSNNNAPQFEQSEYTFVLGTPTLVDLPMFSVSASDSDEGINAQIIYSISGGNGTSKFSINDQTGDISVIDNYQLQSMYTLIVSAFDGTSSSSASVDIFVKPCGFQNLLLLPTFTMVEQPESLALRSIILDSQSWTTLEFGQTGGILEYSLSVGGPVFDVNPENGQIFLSEELDRESVSTHFIVLQVRDASSSVQRIAQAEIEFVVLDVNDNAPRFDRSPYVETITNNITQGSEVTRVRATDQDEGANRDVTYSLLSDPSNSFSVNPITGVISVISPLNSDSVGSSVNLVVQATDGGDMPLSSSVTVSINIVDSRAPRFTMNVYRVSINESVETGTDILTVGVNAVIGGTTITYRIMESDDLSVPFHLTFLTGVMTVVDPGVDFEMRRLYRFNIVANDLSTSLTGLAVVEIFILDVNDNSPVFNQSNNLYTIQVSETVAQGSPVLRVYATDDDTDSQITYQIAADSQFLSTFDIDQNTGNITTAASLDYEQFPIYQFQVQAVDSGQPPQTGTATVRIVTLNENDNRPMFAQELYTSSISESATPGTNVIFVSATDPDGLQDLTYSIVLGSGSQNFDILSNGLIVLSEVADLIELQYVLNVSASDGMFEGFTSVRIDVQDNNDYRPEFNQSIYYGTVVEGSSPGQFVTQVFADDLDRGSNGEITYSTSNDIFTVGSTSGIVTTRQSGNSIDREDDPVLRFIIVATDGGGRSGIANVEVTVLDINDNAPTFTVTEYNVNVIETREAGSSVLTVQAVDPDEGNNGTLVYSINQTLGDQFIFRIDSMGVVSLLVSPDFRARSIYTFTVSVRDDGTPQLSASTDAMVTINILEDTGQAPPEFTQNPYIVSVGEDIRPFSDVVTVQLTSASSQNCPIVSFSITFQQVQNLFSVRDPAAGTIQTRAPLVVRNYTLIVRVQCTRIDANSVVETFNTVQVIIAVQDLNSPPTFEGNPFLFQGSIPEDSLPFTPVQTTPTIVALDNDPGDNGTLHYELAGLNGAPFDIHFRSGSLFIDGPVDHERAPSYQFTVVASDLGSPPLSVTSRVVVFVEDVNDSPPVFEQQVYNEEVTEGLTTDMTLFTVRARDNDSSIENRNITYSLSGNAFHIITTVDVDGNKIGEVQATIDLDRETVSSYMLQVIASDGVATDQADVFIVVTDINDQTPEFNQTIYSAIVPEDIPIGEIFVQVFATDNDVGENATVYYTIVEQPDNGEVRINSTTGEISFVTEPNHEISPVFEFQVGAMDIGERQGFATVAVTLEDVNDNSPRFVMSNYNAEIAENLPAGNDIIRIEATDPDSENNAVVVYSVDGSGAEYFDIGASDGFITNRQSFDREANDSFVITIVATDSGTPPRNTSVQVTINVTDVNDEKPVFPSAVYELEVSESAPIEHLITTVRAEDGDIGVNAELTYTLSGEDFALETHSNGSVSLRTRRPLNHERIALYNLTLTAVDGGSPILQSGTATLLINVLDENEHPPVFSQPIYPASPYENATIGSVIATVKATDRDPTDEVVFAILNGGNYPEFSISATSGQLTLESALDFEHRPQYNIIIQASDLSDAPLTATAEVQVIVININDKAPIFLPHEPTITVVENSIPNPPIITFRAEDPESDDISCSRNDVIAYTIVSGNVGNVFELQGLAGVLSVRQELDREQRDEYNLVISASDVCVPPFSSTTNLTVIVDDVNDNSPTGGHQIMYLYLLNGIAPNVSLGMVFVNDSDIVNDHSFELVDSGNGVFQIEGTGIIRVASDTPELGTHELFVTIRDGNHPPASTTITAVIQSVTSDVLLSSSFIMRFEGMNPQRFVDKLYVNLLSVVNQTLNRALNITTADLQVFSIQASSDEPGNLDVVLAARSERDGTYFHPNLVQHIIHINREEIETAINIEILTELIDLCASESCSESSRCSNAFAYNAANTNPNAIGSSSITYLGLSTQHTPMCASFLPCEVLSCSEPSYCLETGNGKAFCYDDCNPNPCKNEGFCTPQNPGYHCSCPVGHDGRNCELVTASFVGNSYAVFPSLTARVEGTISFEVITEERDGLIFYNGRFDREQSDFIALELEDGFVSLQVSYGGTEVRVVQRNQTLNDQTWHTVTVQYNASVVSVTVKTFDPYTTTTSATSVQGNFYSLDLGAPLVFGSLPQTFDYVQGTSFPPFTGCIRNFQINGDTLDFSNPLVQVGVIEGCLFTGCEPNPPCKNDGRCAGYWGNNFVCDCAPRFAGETCERDSEISTFSGKEFIRYQLKSFNSVRPLRQTDTQTYTTAQNIISMSFATKDINSTLLQLGDPDDSMEYAILEIANEYLQFRYNLGSGEWLVQVNSVSVTDNVFHSVTVTRTEQSVEMLVDDSYVNRTVSPGTEATLDIPIAYIYLGGSVNVRDDSFRNGFSGCIMGTRIDRKELPAGGGENNDFTTVTFSSGIKAGCPIGSLQESPQEMSYVYIVIGVGIPVLVIVVTVFVVVCMLSQWCWNQNRERTITVNTRRRSQGGGGGGGRDSPGQNGFSWQPATYNMTSMTSPHGTYKTTLDSPGPQESRFDFNFDNVSSVNSPPTNVPTPVVPVKVKGETDTEETSFIERTPESRRSTRRHNTMSPPVEGFSLVSQANPGYLEESPKTPRRNLEKSEPPSVGHFHARSLSGLSGHQSMGSLTSDATSAPPIDVRDFRAVHKRVEVANNDNENANIDELKHYKEEGAFEPLGSLGSLLDFLIDVDNELSSESLPLYEEKSVQQVTKTVTREETNKNPSTEKSTKSQQIEEKNRRNVSSKITSKKKNGLTVGSNSAKTRLISQAYQPGHIKSTNILERFHNEMFGHRPTPMETSALV